MEFLEKINVGYEIEGYIETARYTAFVNKIKTLHDGIIVGGDGSIMHPNGTISFEIKTPPLRADISLSLLKDIFDIMKARKAGTNKSTGLHVNISYVNKLRLRTFNPFTFVCSKMWQDILEKYRRDNNRFCKWQHKSLHELFFADTRYFRQKYHAVSFSHFPTRIEIRAFGNTGYHKRFKSINADIINILKHFDNSTKKAA